MNGAVGEAGHVSFSFHNTANLAKTEEEIRSPMM